MLTEGKLFSYFLSVLPIIGTILTVLAFISRVKVRKLVYVSGSFPIISKKDQSRDSYKIMVGDKQVPRIIESRIALWNDGSKILKKKHLSDLAPIRISFKKGVEFYDVRLVCSDPECKVNYRIKKHHLELSFTRMNRSDYCVVFVKHNCYKKRPFKITGTVLDGKGIQRFTRNWLINFLENTRLNQDFVKLLGKGSALSFVLGGSLILSWFLFFYSILMFIYNRYGWGNLGDGDSYVWPTISLFVFLGSAFFGVVFLLLERRMPKKIRNEIGTNSIEQFEVIRLYHPLDD